LSDGKTSGKKKRNRDENGAPHRRYQKRKGHRNHLKL
jgi:hypothetical protein